MHFTPKTLKLGYGPE